LFASCDFGCESEYRLEQAVLGIPDRELSRVNTHREPTRTGCDVIAGQRSLATLVELSFGGEGQWMSGNDLSGEQVGSQVSHGWISD
jgi:hypothetical protein